VDDGALLRRGATVDPDDDRLEVAGAFLRRAIDVGVSPQLFDDLDGYEQAVALDSTFAQAWAQLARANGAYYYNIPPNPASAAASRRAAERAAALILEMATPVAGPQGHPGRS